MLVIANGFNRFHLAVAAAEAHRRGLLTCFITGAYPTPAVRRALALGGLWRDRRLARLAARREAIPDAMVRAMWTAEAIYAVAMAARRIAPRSALWLNAWSFRHCGARAVRCVRRAAACGARIYHYRSGFGHRSVREAKRLGMVALCDHSIAHPALLPRLIVDDGRMPPRGARPQMDRLWAEILEDVEQADAVLVNSDFVRETFLRAGEDPARIHVIYWGVDDAFLEALPAVGAGRAAAGGPLRMLFAGAFERRKGADTLVEALQLLDAVPWTLEIAGEVGPQVAGRAALLRDPRVTVRGWLPRRELARLMSRSEVFVFPSLAEGSARVVFEALAAGCYVITTPNAGSIVEDGVHGRLVAPGAPAQLAAAIRAAAARRAELGEVGRRNAALVRARYRQRDYGEQLAALYAQLLGARPALAS